MYRFICTACFLFVLNAAFSQGKTSLVVEVAAFAESAPDGYFDKVAGVYETLDVNYIYRYYVNVPDINAAESKKKEVREAGFINARIIDFAQLKKECAARCHYDPPKNTGKRISDFGFNPTRSTGFDPNAKPKETAVADPNVDQNIQYIYPSSGSADSPENFHCIFFDFDKSNIREDAEIELKRLVSLMRKNPTHQVQILAHTDARGTTEYNNALSMRRAVSTQNYLTEHGIKRTKILKKPFGESSPIALNELASGEDTVVGRQLNRRVEFIILDESGKILNVVDKINVPEKVQK